MTKILVTGSSGFIGKHLVPKLIEAGHEVFEVNRLSGEISDELTWMRFQQAEVVIHLAGKSFVPDSWSDPALFMRVNLMGTIAALNYCKRNEARLIYVSSYLYGNPLFLPISESSTLVVNNPYALSKKLAEETCKFYSSNFGIYTTVLRPFNIYGPGQSDKFLIPSIISQINSADSVCVRDLQPKRDFVYIHDFVRAIVTAVNYKEYFKVFNIGSGLSYSVEEVIRAIQAIKGSSLPVYSENMRRKDEIMNTVADITEAHLHLGWSPQTSLYQGLEQMLNHVSGF